MASLLKKLKRLSAAPKKRHLRRLLAKYDAAQTTIDNIRHWAMADSLSADAAASSDVRKKIRERARYEVANNSYAKGITLTLADYCVGTGPRLQLLTGDNELNNAVETEFEAWAHRVNLPAKLRTMRTAKLTDGEAFALLVGNPKLKGLIKLDVALVEADRVTTPSLNVLPSSTDIDGITLDRFGNPIGYTILNYHPGDISVADNGAQYITADSVIHWFRVDRPGQHRGIPEIAPALPLFAQLRRYTLAVLAAAETAAEIASVLYADPPADGEIAALEPMDVVELERRMTTVMPEGWKLGQLKAEQPTTTYSEFKRELLNEIARCFNMPLNIALCNSAGYNYASGRLDHQTFFRSIRVEQADMSAVVLDKILEAWVNEAMLTTEFAALRNLRALPHQWFFDGNEHVDPAKEANAQQIRLNSNTTTLAAEYARQGKDWETELYQRAKEKQLMKKLGLTTETKSVLIDEDENEE